MELNSPFSQPGTENKAVLKGNSTRSVDMLLTELSSNSATISIDWETTLDENFANLSSLADQIEFIRTIVPEISTNDILRIFKTSTTTYYKHFGRDGQRLNQPISSPKRSNNSIATIDEEKRLVNWVQKKQYEGNCVSPRECRSKIQSIIKKNRNKTITCDRKWWMRFRSQYQIDVTVCSSLEEDRAAVTLQQCEEYITQLEELVKEVHPGLFFNMDETGFIKRYQKASYKKCAYLKALPVKPRFIEKVDSHHISLVGCISLDNMSVKPHIIGTLVNLPEEIRKSPLYTGFNYSCSKKGYMNSKVMVEWLSNTFIPHIKYKRSVYGLEPDTPTLLLMDGLKAHISEEAIQLMNTNHIVKILLPPHSSHLFQPLDLIIFGKLKRTYGVSEISHSVLNHKFSKKVDKILEAFRRSTYLMDIQSAWSKACIQVDYDRGVMIRAQVNRTLFTKKLIAEIDHTYAQIPDFSEPQSNI